MPHTASYAAFRVDPSINFDNFIPPSPSVSNFSRPMSHRPVLSPHSANLSFALSDSSRRSSCISTKGPSTPKQDLPLRDSIAGPKFVISDEDQHNGMVLPSFMMDSHQSPKLDLSFAVESVMRSYQPSSTPQSPIAPMSAIAMERPRTAGSLAPSPLRPMTAPRVCPVHGVRQSTIAPVAPVRRPCPIHGLKQPTSSPLSTNPVASPRESISERPQEIQRIDSAKTLPSLPFLQHDPFQSLQEKEQGNGRPKSAGAGASGTDLSEVDFVFDRAQPMKKQSAPSIMSTRSTRSIRKGLSRVRRMLARTKAI